MMSKKPEKINIKEIDHFEVRVDDTGTYRTAKTKEEAEKIGKEWLKEQQKEWERYKKIHDENELIRKENLYSFQNYHRVLRKRLSWLFKDKKAIPKRDEVLRIVRDLKHLAEHKVIVAYCSFSDSFNLRKVEE